MIEQPKQSKQNNIIKLRSANSEIEIQDQLDLQQFRFIAQGAYKLVFNVKNKNSKWFGKVLMLPKRQTESPVDYQISSHYYKQLSKTNIKQFMYQKCRYRLVEFEKDFHKIKQYVASNVDESVKICQDANFLQIIIAEDVFYDKEHYDLVLEVKTKTIVPDKYYLKTIQQVARQKLIPVQQIFTALKNSDNTEKTKWFKSKIAHRKRQKQSSFHYYGLSQQINQNFEFSPMNSKNVKFWSNKFDKKLLAHLLFQNLRKSGLLHIIHRILKAVSMGWQASMFPDILEANKITSLPVELPNIIVQEYNQQKDINYFQQQFNLLTNESCLSNQFQQMFNCQHYQSSLDKIKWATLFRYLVFICISDMSIVGKIKLNTNQFNLIKIKKIQFKILDFQLIPLKHVLKRFAKNQSVFSRWVDYRFYQNAYGLIQSQQKQHEFGSQTIKDNKFEKVISKTNRQEYENMSQAKHLNLCNQNIGCIPYKSKKLIKMLDSNHYNLLQLKFDSSNITIEELSEIVNSPSLIHLKTLKLNYNRIGDQGMKMLSKGQWSQLQHLYLNWNNITSQGASYLRKWPHLKSIHLSENNIQDQGTMVLSTIEHSQLQLINLWQNQIKIEGLTNLCSANLLKLQKIIIGGNNIDDQGVLIIAKSDWPCLKLLDLSVNSITFQLPKLALSQPQKLFNFPKLLAFKLGTNKITGQGTRYLSAVGLKFPVLKCLDLYSNAISDEGIQQICKQTWPKLQVLDISMNEISDQSAPYINNQSMPSLTKLIVLRNDITLHGLQIILNFQWNNLRYLCLKGNQIMGFQSSQAQQVARRKQIAVQII